MVHTKKIIKETFWEIPEEKSYNKITVQDIVNRCQVNRNTFYYHFQDIPTLMIDSIEDWMADVIQKYGTLESAGRLSHLYGTVRMHEKENQVL